MSSTDQENEDENGILETVTPAYGSRLVPEMSALAWIMFIVMLVVVLPVLPVVAVIWVLWRLFQTVRGSEPLGWKTGRQTA